jgi:hypothetical protein
MRKSHRADLKLGGLVERSSVQFYRGTETMRQQRYERRAGCKAGVR